MPGLVVEAAARGGDGEGAAEPVPGVDREVGVARAGFRLGHGDPEPKSPPPALGADTDAVLADLGCSAAEIEGPRLERVV